MVSKLVSALILLVCTMLFMICILTPEKTNSGYYTDPYKYWTDDNYFQQNFTTERNSHE